MMKKTVVRIIVLILWILSIFLSFYVGRCYQWASTTELEMSKDYNEITVGENEIMDYSVFIDIPEKYKALEQIEEKKYEASLLEKGISKEKIRKYGFAFEGKKVLIGS